MQIEAPYFNCLDHDYCEAHNSRDETLITVMDKILTSMDKAQTTKGKTLTLGANPTPYWL